MTYSYVLVLLFVAPGGSATSLAIPMNERQACEQAYLRAAKDFGASLRVASCLPVDRR